MIIAHDEIMIRKGPSSEPEMILAFLQAEINSPRFNKQILDLIAKYNYDRSIITNPDPSDEEQNQKRTRLLDFRGYNNRSALFTGFPKHVSWEHVELEPSEFHLLKYLNYHKCNQLSENTRLITDGAKNLDLIIVDENFNEHIRAVIAEMRAGRRYPSLVAMLALDNYIIVLEGNTRATAHIAAGIGENMRIILGQSPDINM